MNDVYFKELVKNSKYKMMDELIDKGFVKMIEYDDCVEITIHLADNEEIKYETH